MKNIYALLMRAIHIVLSPLTAIFLHNSRRVRVVVLSGDNILLQRSALGSQKWSLPGGGIEKGETEQDAAIREVAEETDVDIKECTIQKIGEALVPAGPKLYRRWPTVQMAFLTTSVLTKISPRIVRPIEVLEVQWFSLNNIPKLRSKTVDIGLSFLRQAQSE